MYERRLVRRYGRVELEEEEDDMLYVTGGNGLLGRERSMIVWLGGRKRRRKRCISICLHDVFFPHKCLVKDTRTRRERRETGRGVFEQ